MTPAAPSFGPARVVSPIRAQVGEGPVVTEDGTELLWADILGRKVHRTSLAA